jgi:hypothetical protein
MWREVETGCWVRKMIAHIAFVFVTGYAGHQKLGARQI